ncbi:MAG: glycosyltransferase, partial [Candidatus Bipolaricaulota bacterium]
MAIQILIFGNEIGGQMQLLANGLRSRGIAATAAAEWNPADKRRFLCDMQLGMTGHTKCDYTARRAFAVFAMANYDIFHFFFGVSLLSIWRFHKIDLPLLKAMKKRVFVHFRGSDVRDSHFFDAAFAHWGIVAPAGEPPRQWSRCDQERSLRLWRRWADVLLISEPGLWDLVPDAILSPQVLDMAEWRRVSPIAEKDEINIVHAPTNRRKKGTEFVIAACEALRGKGLPVRLHLIEGMPYSEVRRAYEAADIAVDQVLYGWHGKFSLELMAMGVPVVCYIREDLRQFRPDLPIISATPTTLAEVLEGLIRDTERRRRLAEAGPAYVRKYHSLEVILDQLVGLYGIEGETPVASHWLNPTPGAGRADHAARS